MLVSCKSVRYVDRVQADSAAIRERDSLHLLRIRDSAAYNSLIQVLSEQNIQFRDTGSVKIIYRPDGSVKSIEGEVKSVSLKLARTQAENSVLRHTLDSVIRMKTKDSVRVETRTKTVEHKVNILPWWWLVAAGILGIVLGKISLNKKS
jgi:hypothetical protein